MSMFIVNTIVSIYTCYTIFKLLKAYICTIDVPGTGAGISLIDFLLFISISLSNVMSVSDFFLGDDLNVSPPSE
jgi:hypothetical protein